MAIQKPILDSGPTVSRAKTASVVLPLQDVVPPTLRYYPDGKGGLIFDPQQEDADSEGRIVCFFDPSSFPAVKLYVVADTGGGNYKWTKVRMRITYLDAYSGLPWNPRAGMRPQPGRYA